MIHRIFSLFLLFLISTGNSGLGDSTVSGEGKVVKFFVKPGTFVRTGEPTTLTEAMKMEMVVRATSDGYFQPNVQEGDLILDGIIGLIIPKEKWLKKNIQETAPQKNITSEILRLQIKSSTDFPVKEEGVRTTFSSPSSDRRLFREDTVSFFVKSILPEVQAPLYPLKEKEFFLLESARNFGEDFQRKSLNYEKNKYSFVLNIFDLEEQKNLDEDLKKSQIKTKIYSLEIPNLFSIKGPYLITFLIGLFLGLLSAFFAVRRKIIP